MVIFSHWSYLLVLSSDADITLETAALNTHNNVAVIVTDTPPKHALISHSSKLDKSPILWFLHADCHSI
jgi:hypothetical protein